MYGLVFEIVEEWVIELHGLDVWHTIKKNAGCHVRDQAFLRRSYYPDDDLVDIIVAASQLLNVAIPDLLEAFGHYVIRHHFRNGYDDLLRCQGSTLRQWLSNLNAMHDHVQKTFPGENFQAPIFWCEDCDQIDGSIQLHYYSLRGTLLVPMVVGIVEELASFHFQVQVKMTQLCLQDDEDGSPFTTWRITAVNKDQQWKLSPKCQTEEVEEPVDFSKVKMPSKCPFTGKQLKKDTPDESHTSCPYSPTTASSSSSSPTKDNDDTTTMDVGLTVHKLREIFPFHVLVNQDFTIVQVGSSLPSLLHYKSQQDFYGKHISNFLEISRPVLGSAWCWKALQKLADQHFFLVPSSGSGNGGGTTITGKSLLHKRVSMEDSAVKFKGSMVKISSERVMFVLAPDARNVVDLNSMGLTMSDLPLLSCQRDTVFLGEYIHQEVDKAHKLDKLSKKLANEKNLSNTLLYNILPKHVADELRAGKMVEPMYHEKTTLFYSDIEGFTEICDQVDAWDVIDMLNQLYSVMDFLAAHFKLYKLETIGDAYLCCAGLEPDEYHAERVANFALAVVECVGQIKSPTGQPLKLRIGVHTGSCTSGVVGTLTPRYCLFGDFVNTTARHESTGEPGRIHCSSVCYGRLKHFSMFGETEQYKFTPRGLVDMKGKGESYTYWLDAATDNNKAANRMALQELSDQVANLLAKKSWKMRKYFRRNGGLRDEIASLGGGSTVASSSIRSSQSGTSQERHQQLDDEPYAHRLPPSDDGVSDDGEDDDASDDGSNIAMEPYLDPEAEFTDHEEVDDMLDFAEEMGYKKDWTKLALGDDLSMEQLKEKAADIVVNAMSECIHCGPGKMNIVTNQLSGFVERIASEYNEKNRYHNFRRACHVLVCADFLWQKLRSQGDFHQALVNDSWDRLILVLSALILDVQHSGVQNSELKAADQETKRGSLQERKSLRFALGLLEDEFPELYDEITFGSPKALNAITRLVLASDQDRMKQRLENIQETMSNPCMSDRARTEKNQAAMELVLMAADVSHYSQDTFTQWTHAKLAERIYAHESLRSCSDPRPGWLGAEDSFFENLVLPLITQLEMVLPRSSCDVMGGAERNLGMWRARGAEFIKDNQLASAGIGEILQNAENPDAAEEAAFEMLEKLLKEVVASHENEEASTNKYLGTSAPGKGNPVEAMQIAIPMKQTEQDRLERASDAAFELSPDVRSELRDYVKQVAGLYRANHFHSFHHALNVAMLSKLLLERIESTVGYGGAYGIIADPLARFAVVFSALIHDVDHSGVPNGQLAIEQPELASAYKNKSIAEQHSIVTAWDLLQHQQFHNLQAALFASEGERERLQNLIINSVMATDIFDKDLKAFRSSRWEKAFMEAAIDHPVDAEDEKANIKATIVIEHIIQASDVAHTMQNWSLYTIWNEKLFKEMYGAFKQGRAEKDPSEGWYKGELWFFDNWVLPLATKLKECGVFGIVSDEFLAQARNNRKMWQQHGEEICRSMLKRAQEDTKDDDTVASRPVEDSLLVVLRALIEIRKMRTAFATKTTELSTLALDGGSPSHARRASNIVEEVESITRVVNRFEKKMEKGVQSLIDIAYSEKDDQTKNASAAGSTQEQLGPQDFKRSYAGASAPKGKQLTRKEREETLKQGLDFVNQALDTVFMENTLLQ